MLLLNGAIRIYAFLFVCPIQKCFLFNLLGLPLGIMLNPIIYSIGLDCKMYIEHRYSFSSVTSHKLPGILIGHICIPGHCLHTVYVCSSSKTASSARSALAGL